MLVVVLLLLVLLFAIRRSLLFYNYFFSVFFFYILSVCIISSPVSCSLGIVCFCRYLCVCVVDLVSRYSPAATAESSFEIVFFFYCVSFIVICCLSVGRSVVSVAHSDAKPALKQLCAVVYGELRVCM